MITIKDIFIAILIGIFYNMIIHKFIEIINVNMQYNNKIQLNLLLSFGSAIIGIIFGMFVSNNAIKLGLYFGSGILLFHSVFYNWNIINDKYKLLMMATVLVILIWFSYNKYDDNDDNS